jgi:RNA polymerase sigma-B factor
MQTLSERERRVLQLRFFQDRTQSEIAKEIGVSQMQISRILRRALTALNERALPRNP